MPRIASIKLAPIVAYVLLACSGSPQTAPQAGPSDIQVKIVRQGNRVKQKIFCNGLPCMVWSEFEETPQGDTVVQQMLTQVFYPQPGDTLNQVVLNFIDGVPTRLLLFKNGQWAGEETLFHPLAYLGLYDQFQVPDRMFRSPVYREGAAEYIQKCQSCHPFGREPDSIIIAPHHDKALPHILRMAKGDYGPIVKKPRADSVPLTSLLAFLDTMRRLPRPKATVTH